MLPIITESEARGDYRCIPKVSKELRYLPKGTNQLRLWFLAFNSLNEIRINFDEASNGF